MFCSILKSEFGKVSFFRSQSVQYLIQINILEVSWQRSGQDSDLPGCLETHLDNATQLKAL